MNILHLDDERWDSGLTHYALEIAQLQHKAGHSVTLACRRDGKPAARAEALKLRVKTFGGLPWLFSLLRSEKWDILNAHTGRMHTWGLALRSAGTPLVRTRGDAREPRPSPFDRFVYRRTAAVIAASEHIARMCAEFLPIAAEKLHVIYPGFEPAPYTAPPFARIGMLGRLDPVKGHTVFLEAVALVLKQKPETRFLIAGQEANVSFDLLSNQMNVLGIAHAVQYVGRVASAAQFMQSCTLGVIASLGSEEISRAALEWMANGRALVGTLVGCLPELIEPGETGLIVPPNDSAALARALLACLNDAEQTKKWGTKAQERLARHFSPEQQLQKTMKVYEAAKKGLIRPIGPI